MLKCRGISSTRNTWLDGTDLTGSIQAASSCGPSDGSDQAIDVVAVSVFVCLDLSQFRDNSAPQLSLRSKCHFEDFLLCWGFGNADV